MQNEISKRWNFQIKRHTHLCLIKLRRILFSLIHQKNFDVVHHHLQIISRKSQIMLQNSMRILRTRRWDDEKVTYLVNIALNDLSIKWSDSDVFQIVDYLEMFRIVVVLKLISLFSINFESVSIHHRLPLWIKLFSRLFDDKIRLTMNQNILIYMSNA
jgi:uncharacterized protein (DUF2132 family)